MTPKLQTLNCAGFDLMHKTAAGSFAGAADDSWAVGAVEPVVVISGGATTCPDSDRYVPPAANPRIIRLQPAPRPGQEPIRWVAAMQEAWS
jgi:hypothetical protein